MTELDWMNIELQKDGENRYLFANLQGLVTPVLWGRPVITSDSMDEGAPANGENPATGGEFLIANFARSSILFDRMSFLFKMGLINDQFIRNERALLVEERLGLGVRRREALVKALRGVTPDEAGRNAGLFVSRRQHEDQGTLGFRR